MSRVIGPCAPADVDGGAMDGESENGTKWDKVLGAFEMTRVVSTNVYVRQRGEIAEKRARFPALSSTT